KVRSGRVDEEHRQIDRVIHRRCDAGARTGQPDELAILRNRSDVHPPMRRIVYRQREYWWMLTGGVTRNDLHDALVVRARRIELRRDAVMSCGPSHLARRAKLVRVRGSAPRHPASKAGTLL